MKFSKQEARLFAFLQDGVHRSAFDIAKHCYIGDPRAVIRDLRNNGILIEDEWMPSVEGGRYKRYWISKSQQSKNGKQEI